MAFGRIKSDFPWLFCIIGGDIGRIGGDIGRRGDRDLCVGVKSSGDTVLVKGESGRGLRGGDKALRGRAGGERDLATGEQGLARGDKGRGGGEGGDIILAGGDKGLGGGVWVEVESSLVFWAEDRAGEFFSRVKTSTLLLLEDCRN